MFCLWQHKLSLIKKKKKTFSSHHFLQDNTHCTSHHWLYETFCCVGVQLSSFFFHVWLPRQQITIWLPCEVRDKYEARLTAQTCPGEQGDRRETCSDPVWIAPSICIIGWNELWGPPADCVIQSSFTWKLCPVSLSRERGRHTENEHERISWGLPQKCLTPEWQIYRILKKS